MRWRRGGNGGRRRIIVVFAAQVKPFRPYPRGEGRRLPTKGTKSTKGRSRSVVLPLCFLCLLWLILFLYPYQDRDVPLKSAGGMVNWRLNARLNEKRSVELDRLQNFRKNIHKIALADAGQKN